MVKTASLLVRIKPIGLDYFSMCLRAFKTRILPVLLLTLLTSCSTQQTSKPTTASQTTTEPEEITIDSAALSAEQHLALAKTLASDAAVMELITATKLFFQQKNYAKALWLADKTLPLIDAQIANPIQARVQLLLIKISSLQHLGYYSASHIQLEQLEQYTLDNDISLSATYYRLLSSALQAKQQAIAALNAQLYAFSLTQPSAQSKQQIEDIWHNLIRLSQWQLSLLALDKAPESKGWLRLTVLANKYGGKQGQMQYHLAMWQKKFKRHPANVIAIQLAEQSIIEKNIENIAVILPLTGKQHAAGLAIQQGILASFANDDTKKLHFLDSNMVNWYGLSNELATLKIDYVIGPLLKKNVDQYISHTSAQAQSKSDYMLNANSGLFNINHQDNNNQDVFHTATSVLDQPFDYISAINSDSAIESYLQGGSNSKAISTLLLNIPAKASLTEHHTVLSMRPEDEAKQAAATLSRQNYQHPIVLSQKNVVSKRIAQAFVKQWQRITGNTIAVVYYNTGAQMQANIKASLSVDKSKTRINKLKSQLNQSIKAQTRNRRDIDMIYLVGTPEQTRLVKPYIEVNISPFAKIIPVFASSRSHSTRSDYSSNSDLQGLTFTEIPWLLTSAQNTELATLSQQLWPKRSDGLSRLFAMGYDSYQLISKIPLMQQAPYLQHWGQTGTLKLNKNNILTRSLLWGSYKNNKVVSIAME
ncbi:penicillin-binding protein activator LpoA [Colwellia marinimaniae]|uniref:Penicillin-binding protein activator LpoA n=2 Tax=Colwellia marinimaniae TaxID=1513592 RepID=A0ABQ0MQB7_9GAMM|nr:penicillin-binding protein activator LpoA [Colwellia marinimaniae]